MGVMERVARKFKGHEHAALPDRNYYLSLTPAQRVDILLDLAARRKEPPGATEQKFARVYRIVKLSSC